MAGRREEGEDVSVGESELLCRSRASERKWDSRKTTGIPPRIYDHEKWDRNRSSQSRSSSKLDGELDLPPLLPISSLSELTALVPSSTAVLLTNSRSSTLPPAVEGALNEVTVAP